MTKEQARSIVKIVNIVSLISQYQNGVNPRGLQANHIWQMDVTHIPEFGKIRYMHVSIDTYSGFIVASLQSGEKTKDIINHCLYTFSILGVPKTIKTDNGPGYTSLTFKQFCSTFGIYHVTGIPYNPQGQGIIERAHLTIKTLLINKKGE